MKEIKVICDSCKKDVGDRVYSLDLHAVRSIAVMGDNRTPFDLCGYCFDKVCSILKIHSHKEFPKF